MLYNGLSTTSPPSKAQAQPLVKIVPLNPQDPNVRPVTAPKKGIFAAAALSEKLDSASLGKAATTTPRYATKAGDRVHDHVLVRGTGSTSGTTKLGGTVTAVQNQANKALYDVPLDDNRKIEASSVSADGDDDSLFSEDATSSEGDLASPRLRGPHQDEVRLPGVATMGDATVVAATSVAPSTQAAPANDYDTDNAATVQPELRPASGAVSKADNFKQARQTKRKMAAPASARSTPGLAAATATAATTISKEVVPGKRKLSEDDSDDDKADDARAPGGNKKKTKIERADGTIINCEYNIQRLNTINIFPGNGDSRVLGDALKTLATSETEGAGVAIGAGIATGGSAPRLAETYGRGHQALSAEPSSRDLLQAVVALGNAMLSAAPGFAGNHAHGANTMPGLHAQPPLPPPPPHPHAAGFMDQQQAQPGLLAYPTFQEYAPAPPPAPAPIPAPGVGIGAAFPGPYAHAYANPFPNPNPNPNPNPYYQYPASPMLQHLQPQFQPQVAATNNLNPQVFDANANANTNALSFLSGAPGTPGLGSGPRAGPGPNTMQARAQAAGAGAYPYEHEYEHAHGHGGQEFEFPGFMSEGEQGDEDGEDGDEDAEGEEDDGQYEYVYGYGDLCRTPSTLSGGFPSQM